jgi:hypothetical protein
MKPILSAALLVGSMLGDDLALAHHGRGNRYDMDAEIELRGTVRELVWRNPHIAVLVDVPGDDGAAVTWIIEHSNVSTLARLGYHRNSLRRRCKVDGQHGQGQEDASAVSHLPTPESMDNIGPSWYGHSVAEWDGDTLVVNTIGMDDRAWLDSTGHVKSFEARVEERYRRIGPDTIELRMALYDPTYYTEPWEAETRIFEREPRERITYFGWYGIFSGITDLMCAPMNAIERFREGAY